MGIIFLFKPLLLVIIVSYCLPHVLQTVHFSSFVFLTEVIRNYRELDIVDEACDFVFFCGFIN